MVVTNKNGEQCTLKQVMYMHSVFLLNQTHAHSQPGHACKISLKCFAKMCMCVCFAFEGLFAFALHSRSLRGAFALHFKKY